jgi:DNA-binding LacI/PurR family transcriptional regulator
VVTIRDVAKHAGVSPATVSRVVNGLVGYSDETRERVETAVKSLSHVLRSRDLGPKIMPHRLIERGSTSCLS